MIFLDTHIFVWWNQNDPKLTNYHRDVINNERQNGLGVCTISLIEIARLVSAGRIILPYEKNQLRINLLQGGKYQQVSISPTFPKLAISELVREVLAQSSEIGRSPALRAFRKRLKQLLPH